jgi:hypothetical protein
MHAERLTAQYRFSYGDCHILAMRIHRLTGWPIATFCDSCGPHTHAFVRHPDGDIVDVNGKQTEQEFRLRWAAYCDGMAEEIREWTIPELEASIWDTDPQFNGSVRAARDVAGRLLASLGWKA